MDWKGRCVFVSASGQTENSTLRGGCIGVLPGQYYDSETGLHYNLMRYYDPGTGRYLTTDPTGLSDGPNPYVYAHNNPLKFYDPNGEAAQAAMGCLAGSWAGPVGCGVGAAAVTLATAVGVSMMVSGDTPQDHTGSETDTKKCKDDDECDLEFVREMPSFDGKTKACIYRRKGVMFTFPQAVGYPCPPIDRKRCMVDTSFIRPPARY